VLDLLAEGGLGDAEAGGGAAEMQLLGDGGEVAEVAELHDCNRSVQRLARGVHHLNGYATGAQSARWTLRLPFVERSNKRDESAARNKVLDARFGGR
jgi:hypothetical protein